MTTSMEIDFVKHVKKWEKIFRNLLFQMIMKTIHI